MRSAITFLLLVFSTNVCCAQTAALEINNVQNPCNLYVGMHASTSADGLCSVQGNTFIVPAGTSVIFSDYHDFQTRIGWLVGGPFASVPPYIDFKWTEVDFQEGCPPSSPLVDLMVGGLIILQSIVIQAKYVGRAGAARQSGILLIVRPI